MKKHPTEKDHTLCRLVREARPIWKWLLLGCLISIVMIAGSVVLWVLVLFRMFSRNLQRRRAEAARRADRPAL